MGDYEITDIVEVVAGTDDPEPTRTPGQKRRSARHSTRYRLTVPMTVLVQDPSVTGPDERILTAQVPVPVDRLEPGPRTSRFVVEQHRSKNRQAIAPTVLTAEGDDTNGWTYRDRFARRGNRVLRTDADFRAQNAYAVAARTLATFEHALGRRLPWAFGAHQLTLIVAAAEEPVTGYQRGEHRVQFGYYVGADGAKVHTALSHDVVAHEVTHAILDGLRPRYDLPSLPDQEAFHEAFADIVALLSVFRIPGAVEATLPPAVDGRIPVSAVSVETLKAGPLFGVGEEIAGALRPSARAMRRAVAAMAAGGARQKTATDAAKYKRGDVLVAAVMSGLLAVWTERLKALEHGGQLSKARAAEEGAEAADDLLTMCIRAIDYTPPVEFEFGDYLDALLLVDKVVSPDDPHRYRAVLPDAFGRVGIRAPRRRIKPAGEPVYQGLNFDSLRSDPDEVYRYIWHNAGLLDLDLAHPVRVERVYRARRVGPHGLVIDEGLADYTQHRTMTVADLRATLREHRPTIPRELPADAEVQLWGGGTLVFDGFGCLRYHQTKALDDWPRQAARLRYLSDGGKSVESRYGFADG